MVNDLILGWCGASTPHSSGHLRWIAQNISRSPSNFHSSSRRSNIMLFLLQPGRYAKWDGQILSNWVLYIYIYLVAVVVNRGDRHQWPLSVFPMAHRALPNHRLWLVTWFKLRLLMDPSHVLLPPLRDCGQAGECLAGNGWQCQSEHLRHSDSLTHL